MRANAKKVRQIGDWIHCNGFWREGRKQNVSINVAHGSFKDHKTGKSGGAAVFAREAFDMGLPEFMRQFGAGVTGVVLPERPPDPGREDLHIVWEDLVARMPRDRADAAARWLTSKRHFPREVGHIVDSGFVTLNASTLTSWPIDIRPWIAWRLQEFGTTMGVPIRDAETGLVCNVHLRPILTHGADSRRFIPGCWAWSPTKAPRVYGLPARALDADLLVVVEGAVDQMAAELWVRDTPGASVIGCLHAAQMAELGRWLRRRARGRTVIVPHLDSNKEEAGPRAAAKLMSELRAADIPATFFDWDRFMGVLGVTAKDLGDVLHVGFHKAGSAFRDVVGAVA